MKKMRILIQIMGAILIVTNSFAQMNNNGSISIPEPNVASFTKFIDNPVDHFNGSININIPVYTIKDGDIEIPITLRYNTSGIKVAEEASWVGLGWNLNVGGVITQSVNGSYDSDSQYSGIKSWSDTYSNGALWPEYNVWVGQRSYVHDNNYDYRDDPNNSGSPYHCNLSLSEDNLLRNGNGQPDIFYFSFQGYSGKFFIDYRDGSIHIMDKNEDIKFEEYRDVDLDWNWKATTPDGSVFYFEEIARSYDNDYQIINSVTFYLTKMITQKGKVVNFEYSSVEASLPQLHESVAQVNESYVRYKEVRFIENESRSIVNYEGRLIERIYSDNSNFEINFSVNERKDIPLDKRLDLITVIDKLNGEVKEFEFKYDYFESLPGGNFWNGGGPGISISGDSERATKRLKLISYGKKGMPPHTFSYSSIELPSKLSYAQDYWGYYNGQDQNSTLIPSLTSLFYLSEVPSKENLPLGYGDNRACNPDFTSAGTLESITYPAGGSTKISYETNSFLKGNDSNAFSKYYYPTVQEIQEYNQMVADQKTVGQAYDDNCGAQPTWFPIDLVVSANVKINFRFNKGIGTGADVRDAYGQISTRHPSQNYPIDPIESYSPIVDIDGNYVYEFPFNEDLTAGNYGVYVNIPNELGCQSEGSGPKYISVQADIVITPELVLPEGFGDVSYGAGIRVAKVEQKDTDESVKLKTVYEYSGGTLMSPLQLYYKELINLKITIPAVGNFHEYWMDDEFYDVRVNGNSFVPLSYDANGGLVGYEYVKERKEIPGTTFSNDANGMTKYEYNVSPPATKIGLPSVPQYLNGKLIRTAYYNVHEKIIKSIETNYDYKELHGTLGFKQQMNEYCGFVDQYPLVSVRYFLDNEIETIYDSNELPVFTKTTDYEYNEHNMLTKTTKETSEDANKKITTEYNYVADLTSATGVYEDMQNEHVIAPLLSKSVKVGGVKTYEETYDYEAGLSFTVLSYDDPIPYEDDVFYSFAKNKVNIAPTGGSIENEINIERDNIGNVVQVQKDSDLITSYIWGYNQSVPVAEIIGASYASSISFLSGGLSSIQSLDGEALLNSLNSIRMGLESENAQVTTYTYDILKGITSKVDPNGKKITYKYDEFGRLKLTRDNDEKILTHYEYKNGNLSSPDLKEQTNYIYSYIPQIAFETASDVEGGSVGQVLKTASYFDGLGRPIQTVSIMGSQSKNDIVYPIEYDDFGRQNKNYLPYISEEYNGKYKPTTTDIGDNSARVYEGSPHANFYQESNDNIANDTRPFSETEFEESPLNRPIQQYGVGQDWKDNSRSTNFRYEINNATEVRLWKIEENIPISVAPFEFYNSGELYKNVTVDEQNHEVIEFVDKQQKTILKRVQVHNSGEQEQ